MGPLSPRRCSAPQPARRPGRRPVLEAAAPSRRLRPRASTGLPPMPSGWWDVGAMRPQPRRHHQITHGGRIENLSVTDEDRARLIRSIRHRDHLNDPGWMRVSAYGTPSNPTRTLRSSSAGRVSEPIADCAVSGRRKGSRQRSDADVPCSTSLGPRRCRIDHQTYTGSLAFLTWCAESDLDCVLDRREPKPPHGEGLRTD